MTTRARRRCGGSEQAEELAAGNGWQTVGRQTDRWLLHVRRHDADDAARAEGSHGQRRRDAHLARRPPTPTTHDAPHTARPSSSAAPVPSPPSSNPTSEQAASRVTDANAACPARAQASCARNRTGTGLHLAIAAGLTAIITHPPQANTDAGCAFLNAAL